MITIIDYGAGNLRSVLNAFRYLKQDVEVSGDPDVIARADKLVFPGVGASKNAMEELKGKGLVEPIKSYINSGRPFLGICLGLQLLFERSFEGEGCDCLGMVRGEVKPFSGGKELKVPQIGWNTVDIRRADCPVFKGIDSGSYFYFVHSYYCDNEEQESTAGVTKYGVTYTSALWKDNIFAVQFHPERSQKNGIKFLENFAGL